MTTIPPTITIDDAVTRILERGQGHAAVAAPLGLGKPNHLLNALYRRVRANPAQHLTLYTALSLDIPEAGSELERRFLEPFSERHFGTDYPRLEYVMDLKADRVPANVEIQEFYFQSGAMLGSTQAQREYASINYTLVARDLAERAGLDAIVQLIAVRGEGAKRRCSLSCNPDVTLDVLDAIAARGDPRPLVIGVVHPDLPFLGGAAEVDAAFFDALIDGSAPKQTLFALPLNAVNPTEHAIGLHASSLVRDGGTLQIGIGALSDAIVHALLMRHQRNAEYLTALRSLRGDEPTADALIAESGGVAPFTRGLYGASEMIMDGFMHLRSAGILTRSVYDDADAQRTIDAGEQVDPSRLTGGHYLKGAFVLGSNALYAWLRELDGEDYSGLVMSPVSDVNQLYGGHEQRDATQRRDARFFNTCMLATALGAATSDALEDGRVVSGVGGQYNFVAMAHALHGGRSILLLRATRRNGNTLESNIRWNYGHTTIPRHLRDIYITEYGIADLRGRSDEECVCAMLAICDARFIEDLVRDAIRAGKLSRSFRVPEAWRRNTPQILAHNLKPCTDAGLFPTFPFGSDFNAVEQRLLQALLWLKSRIGSPRRWPGLAAALLWPGDGEEAECIARMQLTKPNSLAERVLQRLLRGALKRTAVHR